MLPTKVMAAPVDVGIEPMDISVQVDVPGSGGAQGGGARHGGDPVRRH